MSAIRNSFSVFAATLHIWRPVLYQQQQQDKTSCRDDRDPPITVWYPEVQR